MAEITKAKQCNKILSWVEIAKIVNDEGPAIKSNIGWRMVNKTAQRLINLKMVIYSFFQFIKNLKRRQQLTIFQAETISSIEQKKT